MPYIPAGNSVTVPEIALFKQAEEKGVAKFVATGYDAKTGKLLATTDAAVVSPITPTTRCCCSSPLGHGRCGFRRAWISTRCPSRRSTSMLPGGN